MRSISVHIDGSRPSKDSRPLNSDHPLGSRCQNLNCQSIYPPLSVILLPLCPDPICTQTRGRCIVGNGLARFQGISRYMLHRTFMSNWAESHGCKKNKKQKKRFLYLMLVPTFHCTCGSWRGSEPSSSAVTYAECERTAGPDKTRPRFFLAVFGIKVINKSSCCTRLWECPCP